MTSISAASGSTYQSPLQLLQAELQSEVNSGAVSSSDQSALSSALTDINSSLQSGSGASGQPASSTNSSPGDLKSKIDNLIAGEVSSGKLTSDRPPNCRASSRPRSPMAPAAPAIRGSAASARHSRSAPPAAGAPGGPGGAGGVHHGHHGMAATGGRVGQLFDRQFVLDRQHQQFVEHQLARRHPAAVSPIAAGFAVELRRRRPMARPAAFQQRQQFVVLGAADQLPDLISDAGSLPADAHTAQHAIILPGSGTE